MAEKNPKNTEDLKDLKKMIPKDVLNHMTGTIYGNCIGDAIGLLTEFMTKQQAHESYGKMVKGKGLHYDMKEEDFHRSRWDIGDWTDDSDQMVLIMKSIIDNNGQCYGSNLDKGLEYNMKVDDSHRYYWMIGDWTDDSDQMILIMQSLIEKEGKIDESDFASKMVDWMKNGFPDLGDQGGCGIGRTTYQVISRPYFIKDPHRAAKEAWEALGRNAAPNGGVMRTSVLGIYQYQDIDKVIENTRRICTTTHADPRCIASCVAVTTAIALMLQRHSKKGKLEIETIIDEAYEYAKKELLDEKEYPVWHEHLKKHMYEQNLMELKLAEPQKIGYTFKTMGAGFWALRQKDFKTALTSIVMEAGDADTNGAVAGALLGCKLGKKELPDKWLKGLKYKQWLDNILCQFLTLVANQGPAHSVEPLVPGSAQNLADDKTKTKDDSAKTNDEGSKEKADDDSKCGNAPGLMQTQANTKPMEPAYPTNTVDDNTQMKSDSTVKHDEGSHPKADDSGNTKTKSDSTEKHNDGSNQKAVDDSGSKEA